MDFLNFLVKPRGIQKTSMFLLRKLDFILNTPRFHLLFLWTLWLIFLLLCFSFSWEARVH